MVDAALRQISPSSFKSIKNIMNDDDARDQDIFKI